MPYSKKDTKTVVIAAANSGAGKTTLALGLMAALKKRGLQVAPFKVGPDFIDPGHHGLVCGRTSRNLDGWMLNRAANLRAFRTHIRGADIAVVEGVMGLYDGFSGRSEAGSTAQMAKWLNAPVLLVINAASMARSAAAMVQGFENFDPAVAFAGVVFNRLGSPRHLEYVRTAMDGQVRMPCLGGILRNKNVVLPERHLGLVTAEDHPLSSSAIDRLAEMVETQINLDRLLAQLPSGVNEAEGEYVTDKPETGQVRIGWARDRAFCFYYRDNLDLLQQYGAELVPFSPITDRSLPKDLDGIYFGGGYPELNAAQLSENRSMRRQIHEMSTSGMPIYGECGGLMYLCRDITDTDGITHPMCGCFPMQTRMRRRLQRLGYREVTLLHDTLLGPRGVMARGHEFHYSEIVAAGSDPSAKAVYRVSDRSGLPKQTEGHLIRRTLGSYVHLHFGSNPEVAGAFVNSCRQYQQERRNLS